VSLGETDYLPRVSPYFVCRHFTAAICVLIPHKRLDWDSPRGRSYVWAAHLMFELPVVQISLTQRTGSGQRFAEAVAIFGLILI